MKKYEFDNLYIDAQKMIVHDQVLAPVAIVTEKGSCQIRAGTPCRAFAESVDLWRVTGGGPWGQEGNLFLLVPGLLSADALINLIYIKSSKDRQ